MKKAVLALAALFATAWAAPAVAAEFSYGGFMRFRYIPGNPGTANAALGFAEADSTAHIHEYRVRQFFNLKVNDHVTTNVKLEWNSQFGDERQLAGGSGDLQFGSGANEVQFRIKNAFLRFDVPNAPLTLTVGQQDFSTPKAIISVEDGTGIKLGSKVGGLDATLFWQRNLRGANNQTGADDADWIGIVPTFQAGDIKISPHVSYLKVGDGSATIPGTEVWYLGVDTSGKLGGLGFTADLVYQNGETGVAPAQVDIASFVLDVSVSLAAGPGTLTVKALYSPGDDNPLDTDEDAWQNFIASDMGWSPLFHDGSSNSAFAGSVTPGLLDGGIIAVGAEFAFAVSPTLTVTPNAYYLMAAEDTNVAGGAVDDFYGIEAGVQANWKIFDAVNFLFQFDYLFAGDVFETAAGETDDVWRFIIGPSISW